MGTVAPSSPTMRHCSARAACETRGKRVCSARWALLSYQRRRHNGPGVLTILPSGESKPWPGSRLAGETCCRTAWLVVTMAPLPWWLMAPEDAASPLAAWLYLTPAKHRQRCHRPRAPESWARALPNPSGPPSPPSVRGTRMRVGTMTPESDKQEPLLPAPLPGLCLAPFPGVPVRSSRLELQFHSAQRHWGKGQGKGKGPAATCSLVWHSSHLSCK